MNRRSRGCMLVFGLALLLAAMALPAPCEAGLPPGLPGASQTAAKPPEGAPAAGQAAEHPTTISVLNDFYRHFEDLWTSNSLGSWGLLLLAIFLGLAAGRIAAIVLRHAALRIERRGWDAQASAVADLVGPAKLALLALGLTFGLAALKMDQPMLIFWRKVLVLLYSLAFFWYGYNLIGVIDVFVRRWSRREDVPLDDQLVAQLVPLIRKSLRIFLVIVAVLFIADSVFEQNIGAILAGLGIAGLAVSLAAQDSLKNLFGSVTILLDRPFKIGERIVFAGYDGVIEEIGFRSTKVRTLTGHLVTIPNSNIVNDPVENIGRRPYIRRLLNVTITYDTPREKIQQAVDILRRILEEQGIRETIHPTINGDDFPPRVYFNDYNADSLNIIVIYWFAPPAYWDYLEHGQRVNLRIFEEFEKAGIEFAFPTQTLYLAGDPKRKLAIEMLGRDLQRPAT